MRNHNHSKRSQVLRSAPSFPDPTRPDPYSQGHPCTLTYSTRTPNLHLHRVLSAYSGPSPQLKSWTIGCTIARNQESMSSVLQIVTVKQLGAKKIGKNGYPEIFLQQRKYLNWYLGQPPAPLPSTYPLPPLSCTPSIPELSWYFTFASVNFIILFFQWWIFLIHGWPLLIVGFDAEFIIFIFIFIFNWEKAIYEA